MHVHACVNVCVCVCVHACVYALSASGSRRISECARAYHRVSVRSRAHARAYACTCMHA